MQKLSTQSAIKPIGSKSTMRTENQSRSQSRVLPVAWQSTIAAPVEFSGVGLHSGEDCRVVIRPAGEYAGICFNRCGEVSHAETFHKTSGLEVNPRLIVAAPDNVVRAANGTMLANSSGVSIATVEHLMAAFAICRLDNVVVDVYGPEIPILDGSSAPFVNKINAVGLIVQAASRREISICKTIEVRDGDRSIQIKPSDKFSLEISIEFEGCMIGHQSHSVTFDNPDLLARMAKARTFCRLDDVEALRALDLVRGGSIENSIVVDGDTILNEGELRDPFEFVLHKALDPVGDLYLLGVPLRGLITAHKPGHDLNIRAACAIQKVQFARQHAVPSIETSAAASA